MLRRVLFLSVSGLSLCMPFTAFGEPEDPLSYYSSTPNVTDDQSLTIFKGKPTSPTATTPSFELSAQPVDNGDQTEVGGKSTADTPAPQISNPSTDNTTQPQADLEPPIAKEVEAEAEIEVEVETQEEDTPHPEILTICNEIGNKLGSVSSSDCLDAAFDKPRFYSNKHRPLLEKHFSASPGLVNAPRILFLGGIHGDEYSSVSLSFKWLKILEESHNGVYDWHFMPLTNPDGLLQKKSTRVNANNVDLNRNFIPSETSINPIKHWQTYAKKRARYYPGKKPLSEPETQAIHKLIHEFKPDIIVSVHAPHGILDYDGGITPPQKLGPLRLRQLGTYPGSLGNYGWFVKQTPVMTIELKHAGIMPSKSDINLMWTDLIHWIKLRTEGDGTLIARKTSDQ